MNSMSALSLFAVTISPPAVLMSDGIVLIYNGADATFAYQPGQALFDPSDPTACIGRSTAPFLRIDDNCNQDEGGTGVGLAIARDIARSHGGGITLGNSPMGGIRATARIPL